MAPNVWQLKVVPPSVKLNVRKSAESYNTKMSGITFRCCYHQLRLSWLVHVNTFVQRPQNVSAREMSLENEKQKRIPSRKFVRENRAKERAKDLKTCRFVTAAKRPMKKWKYVRADFLKSLNVWGNVIYFTNECPKRKLVRPLNKNLLVCTSVPQLVVTFSKQEPCPRPECYKCTNVRRDIKMKNDGHGFCLGL